MTIADPLADRGARLFRFLKSAQELRARPVTTFRSYAKTGAVHWIEEAPEHGAVDCAYRDSTPGERQLLSVKRVAKIAHPDIPATIQPWLKGDPGKATVEPELLDRIPTGREWDVSTQDYVDSFSVLDDHPEVAAAFQKWMRKWRPWAAKEKADVLVRDYYAGLYELYVKATSNTEELELVLGVGLLSWSPGDPHDDVERHAFTCPVVASFDNRTGTLHFTVDESHPGLTGELDMLNRSLIKQQNAAQTIGQAGAAFLGHPLDEGAFAELGHVLVNGLNASGQYREGTRRAAPGDDPVVTHSPALVLRPRTNQGIIKIFGDIAEGIETEHRVPDGLRTLINPDEPPAAQPDPQPGALYELDGETFSPLPLNARQLEIIRSVDQNAQTLVQGPPGTGKTHTAAALLSHLLAQGKRVLVTAHTDRALEEVRGKLPEQIKPLAVSVIGTSRAELTELKTAVETIARRSTDFIPAESQATIERGLARIADLGTRRESLMEALIEARETEVLEHEHPPYSGTLAGIARELAGQADRYDWILKVAGDTATTGAPPLEDDDALRWLTLMGDSSLDEDADDSQQRLVELAQVPTPTDFLSMVTQQQSAAEARFDVSDLLSHEAASQIQALPVDERSALQQRMRQVIHRIESLEHSRSEWVRDALSDIRAGVPQTWQRRSHTVHALLDSLRAHSERIPVGTSVTYEGDIDSLVALSEYVRGYLVDGGTVKTSADGSVKVGAFSPSAVRKAKALFEAVRVNRRQPSTTAELEIFEAHVRATDLLGQLDNAWPADVTIPEEDTISERAAWHEAQTAQLENVLRLGDLLVEEESLLAAAGLPRPDWSDLSEVLTYAKLVDAAAADEAWKTASQPVELLRAVLSTAASWSDAGSCVRDLLAALDTTDHELYARARARLARLHSVRGDLAQRATLTRRITSSLPGLVDAVAASAQDPVWRERLASFTAAWQWADTTSWLGARGAADTNRIQAQIAGLDTQIRETVEAVAAERAWSHALRPERLSKTDLSHLRHYSQLVKKLGKGTGKYAADTRAAIRDTMALCRSSVPVWIMPIYQITQQLQVEENMFDVVIVDEASQAGLEATFLQYLARKIVVIGDNLQVSPTAVGVEQGQLKRLADELIPDHPHKATWHDPAQSFFDEASKRYGGQLTLLEHRRCVPEIIGFSNLVAYEPNNIRLIPVRQFGADRLDPIKVVHLPGAKSLGASGSRVNPDEAEAIVDQIVALTDDPAYDGLTFGVISLQGKRQAQYIEKLLLSAIPAEEWSARQMRVGDAADFQGSERDVVFLSMVSTADEDRDKVAGTMARDLYLQRFNVAVSRAKDQLWLFHSITIQQVPNKDDLRHQLLDYCYKIVASGRDLAPVASEPVSEEYLTQPFRTLFQQRVYNRIAERGYTVLPEFDANGHSIDIVVVGADTRLAVICEGDTWAGPEKYAAELTAQRELVRCGWRFFRIRESSYHTDQDEALAGLWAALAELDIQPYDPEADEEEAELTPSGTSEDPAENVGVEDDDSDVDDDVTDSYMEDSDLEIPALTGQQPPVAVASRSLKPSSLPTASWLQPAPAVDDGHPSIASPDLAGDEEEEDIARRDAISYTPFRGSVPPALRSSTPAVVDGLIEIVRAEGPVTGARLHTIYVQSSGGARVGKRVAQQLNRVITYAVHTGKLVADNPLGRPGVKPKTYRLPRQPLVRVRELGPRKLEDVPPAELAGALRIANAQGPWDSNSELFRRALQVFGRAALTDSARESFEAVMELAFAPDQDEPDEALADELDESGVGADESDALDALPAVRLEDRPDTWRRYGRDPKEWATLVDAALSVLTRRASERGSLTYSELNNSLTEETGLRGFELRTDVGRRALGDLLGDVTRLEFPASGVMLSAIVTLKGQADVGHGFFALAQEMGLLDKGASALDKEAFWISQVSQVHERFSNPAS